MIFVTCRKWFSLFSAVFALCLVMLAGNSLFAQDAPDDRGVKDWQAQRAIKDYINRFVSAQNRYATEKLPNDQFSVRVKIEGLTRVYNKESGWIWVAQFSGAILPKVYKDKEQTYAHAILKICTDKNNDVQVVVNEGQGVWKMTQKTSILYQELPPKPGDWKEWGGPGEPPDPPEAVEKSPEPTGTNPHPAAIPTTPASDAKSKKAKEFQARLRAANNPEGHRSGEYKKIYDEWIEWNNKQGNP